MHRRLPSRRGSALAFTLIAIAVLLLLVVGAIAFTGRNQSAAMAKARGDRTSACSETARRYLLSRLRVFGSAVRITDLKLEQVLPDDATASDRSTLRTGHLGAVGSIATATDIPSSTVSSSSNQVSDAANTLRAGPLGGAYYRVVVMCDEPGGRQAETEFLFRFGL
ncbi:hypothetical protein DRW03_31290 [Corallococcus sp. H22C18031201]|uniref:hypothetical protein n=1 Tax=Citreicoccus inhibens TaxID=2849499 RepID=UPI000E740375|nr:hypothetical protein [Citreicoccus inhibens]MBU8894409.1 hypothetical protein [Citreicoccus inhibens]RJS16201.1 hypothetical protein DRW03_31290 [Corallococcus sp. H22C18031201]